MVTMNGQRAQSLPQETTPLLPREELKEEGRNSVLYRLLMCGLLSSLSFGVTQVPIMYAFQKMTCDAYYETHTSPPDSSVNRCTIREVEARMAREITLIGALTLLCGLVNLLITGWSIKRVGVKNALFVQVLIPGVRLVIQNIGVMVGSNAGIIIMQASQITTVVGGPIGYVLALNSFITDTVEHEERTGALGKLQGCLTVGGAIGFLVGGLLGDAFGILAPFRVTLVLFLLSCIYIVISLPASSPEMNTAATTSKTTSGVMRYIGPLHIFAPQKWTLPSGRTSTQVGALTLAIGVFLGILATGSLTTMLQLYAISEFGFSISANGWLIFMYSLLRGLYLTLLFPRIISWGRKWYQPDLGKHPVMEESPELENAQQPDNHISPREVEITDPMDNQTEPLFPPERESEKETFAFDLLYARFSLLADGILTGLASLVFEGWQLFFVAVFLPLSAGTGSAAKGSLLQMVHGRDRVDALSGLTLVENIARLSTVVIFGLMFATFAEMGKAYLIFVCNAGVALIGVCALLFSHFPPKGSKRILE